MHSTYRTNNNNQLDTVYCFVHIDLFTKLVAALCDSSQQQYFLRHNNNFSQKLLKHFWYCNF